MDVDPSDLEEARSAGRQEAERLDARLREEERQARDRRLEALALGRDPGSERAHHLGDGGLHVHSDLVWRLQDDLKRLTGFQTAVLGSRGWRLLQALRRLVGRAW